MYAWLLVMIKTSTSLIEINKYVGRFSNVQCFDFLDNFTGESTIKNYFNFSDLFTTTNPLYSIISHKRCSLKIDKLFFTCHLFDCSKFGKVLYDNNNNNFCTKYIINLVLSWIKHPIICVKTFYIINQTYNNWAFFFSFEIILLKKFIWF